jgi:hypothetical protein
MMTYVKVIINDINEVDVEVMHTINRGDEWTPDYIKSEITDYGTNSRKYRNLIDENAEKIFSAENCESVYLWTD